jgi:hypothetical protein
MLQITVNTSDRNTSCKAYTGGRTITNPMVPEPEGSSPHLQEPVNDPYHEQWQNNKLLINVFVTIISEIPITYNTHTFSKDPTLHSK